jgi:hypothetical protein
VEFVRAPVQVRRPLAFPDLEMKLVVRWNLHSKSDMIQIMVDNQMKNLRTAEGILTEASRVDASEDDTQK